MGGQEKDASKEKKKVLVETIQIHTLLSVEAQQYTAFSTVNIETKLPRAWNIDFGDGVELYPSSSTANPFSHWLQIYVMN